MTSTRATRQTRVAIDPETHADVFDATVVDGEHWNGFACPSFTYEQAQRVAAWLERADPEGMNRVYFDSDGSTVLLVEVGDVDDDGRATEDGVWVHRLTPDATGHYGIGAYGWTWQEVPADLPHDPAEIDAALAVAAAKSREYCDVWNTALRAAYADGASAPEAVAAAKAATANLA